MENNFESEPIEERMAAIQYEDTKAASNLEIGRRIKAGEETITSLGEVETETAKIFENSTILGKIETRMDHGKQPVALFADIDNTFYHPEETEAMHDLYHLIGENNYGLIYVTGRDLPIVEGQKDLPQADIVVTAVGTEIYVRTKEGQYVADENYAQLLRKNWKREDVYAAVGKIVDERSEAVQFQPRDKREGEEGKDPRGPQEFKISLWVDGENADYVASLAKKMQAEIPHSQIITSEDINISGRYNIDLLPEGVSKSFAVRYLSRALGLKGFVAGDSGNDVAMLIESGHTGILVGGARKDAKKSLVEIGDKKESTAGLIIIREGEEGQRQKIVIGREDIDRAARGIINVLGRADLNPHDAKDFVLSLYRLSQAKKK